QVRPEALLVQVPAGRDSREESPAVALSQVGRTVVAGGEGEQVLLRKVVVETSEEADDDLVRRRAGDGGRLGGGVQRRDQVGGGAAAGGGEAIQLAIVVRGAPLDLDIMTVAEQVIEGEDRVCLPLPVRAVRRRGIARGDERRGRVEVGHLEAVVDARGGVERHGGLEREARYDVPDAPQTQAEAVEAVLRLGPAQVVQRVADATVLTRREGAVLIVQLGGGRQRQRALE